MKVSYAEDNVKGSHGLQESKNFNIRTNAHAFKMLSSGLYSDKIKAVLREIGCNATDAHIEYGTPDRPIEVKLPNRIDKQFYIKDWGPGLSHTDVMELYTTYFASTKQSSNDFTGAFGLGSKSPFSYTDSFSVVSVHKGKKRTYSAHLGNEGSPVIALLTTEDADKDWEHGISVGFPVNAGDYNQFADRAKAVFQWFRIPPKIEGAANIAPAELIFDSPEFVRAKEGGHRVLMGNVTYPLDVNRLQGVTDLAKEMFNFPDIVLRVPIGAVQVAASREELQYDPAGTKYLVKRCEEVAKFVAKETADSLAAYAKADWAGKCDVRDLDSKWLSEHAYYFSWEKFLHDAGYPYEAKLAGLIRSRTVKLPTYCGDSVLFRLVEPTHRGSGARHTVVRSGLGPKDYYGNQSAVHLHMKKNTKIYYGKAFHSLVRAKGLILDGSAEQVILVTGDAKQGTTEVEAKAQAEKLRKEVLVGVDIDDIATVPVPATFVVHKAAKKQKTKGGVLPALPSQKMDALLVTGVESELDVSKAQQHFMLSYNNGYMVRRFESTVQKDTLLTKHDWMSTLKHVGLLQDELGTQLMDGHVFVRYDQMRALDLVKRGWRSTYDVVKEWVHDQKTRDGVAAIAGKWRPTVNLAGLHGQGTWVIFLLWLRHEHEKLFSKITPVIKLPGLAQAIVDIYDASKKAGKNAGRKTPAVIDLYTQLQVEFGAPAITGPVGNRTFLDPDDLNNQLLSTYPMMERFSAGDASELVTHHPTKLGPFLEFLQS